MLGKKITLNKRFCKFLRDTRKASHKSANEVSEAINKSQGWLAQIERGRLKTIKRSDLIDLFMYISGTSKELTKEILDDQLQSIEITEKKNLINSDGELLDFIGYVDFSQMRGHLQYAGKNLREFISDIQNMPSDKIEKELKDLFVQLDTLVITWIIKAFPNLKNIF
jgi:transcriptional regulator with XRE-family HTH domain